MRCVVVNGAKLKAEMPCAHCGSKIGESYIRDIGSRLIYCDFRCYSNAAEQSALAFGYRAPAFNAGMRGS